MKKIVALLLVICMLASLSACGSSSYGVNTVMTLVEQEYSLAFRKDDEVQKYVSAALETMAAAGEIDSLTMRWFGDRIVEFEENAEALTDVGMPAARDFIIGVDINSFPMAYVANGSYWGYDIELATILCEKLGWTLKIQPIEKENVYIELSSGNIDCAWGGIALDPAEIEAGKYSQYGPYVHNDIVVAARDGGGIWNSLKLSGRNMAMCSTTEAMAALQMDEKLSHRLGQITRLAGGTTECFEYLYSGRCDAVLTDSTALYYYNCH